MMERMADMPAWLGGRASRVRALSGFLLALMLAASFALAAFPATPAQAYYNFGTVGVSSGASYLSVQAGQSTSTSIAVSPASDSQTLGCGMAKCPQVCTSDGAAEAGYTCFDVNGQCTCSGTGYSTYYPEVYASSSNAGVATAYVSGGTLVVTGNSAGSATITVSASLRQWTNNSTTIQVAVSAVPSSGGADGGTASGGGTGGSSSGSPSSSGSTGSGTSSPRAAGVPQEAVATDSKDDALNETVVETVAGKVYVVEKNSFLNTQTELAKIIGTRDQAVFWSGAASDRPDYSWTFVGDQVSADGPNLAFDPTITVSKLGTGDVANIMKQAKDGLVMEFAHEGELPGEASIYVKVDGSFADGTELGLFLYNEDSKRFESVQGGVKVEGGYASFKTDHCSSWAFSTDDLTSYAVEETNTPGAIAVDKRDTIAADEGTSPVLVAVAGSVVVAAIVIAVAIGIVVRRRKRADVAGSSAEGDSARDEGRGETPEAAGQDQGTGGVDAGE